MPWARVLRGIWPVRCRPGSIALAEFQRCLIGQFPGQTAGFQIVVGVCHQGSDRGFSHGSVMRCLFDAVTDQALMRERSEPPGQSAVVLTDRAPGFETDMDEVELVGMIARDRFNRLDVFEAR